MNQSVIHQPRVAWDGARAFVAATTSTCYPWLSDQIGRELGVTYQRQLAETQELLMSDIEPDLTHVEAGVWRVRLEDLLRYRPELTGMLAALVRETSAQLAAGHSVVPRRHVARSAHPEGDHLQDIISN
jgi:hypothetical protein